jgi:hypothetical protein
MNPCLDTTESNFWYRRCVLRRVWGYLNVPWGGTSDEATYLSIPSSSNGKGGLAVSFPILLVFIEEAFLHVGLGDIC